MATTGGEAIGQVLYLGGGAEAFLERALAEVSDRSAVYHLVGIATTVPIATWQTATSSDGMEPKQVLLDATGETGPGDSGRAFDGLDVRDCTGLSLGELGTTVIESFAPTTTGRPAVIIDSVAGLTADPGKRFKFLTILGQRVARDDGLLLAFEGPTGLPDIEVHTMEQVFDSVRDAD